MFLGGQTVTFGKVMSVIGLVSMVVLIGLLCQSWNDRCIMMPAPVNPAITTEIQKSLTNDFFVIEMYTNPWIVEDSRNDLTASMVRDTMLSETVLHGIEC